MGFNMGGGGGGGGGGGRGGGGGFDRDDVSLKDLKLEHISRTKDFVAPFKWQLLLAMCLVVATALTGLRGPIIIGQVVDLAPLAHDQSEIMNLVLLYFGLQVLIAALRFSQQFVMSWTGQQILFSIRRKLFAHLQDLGLDFFDKLQAGRIMSRVTNDVEAINQLVSNGTLGLLSDVVTIFGIMITMLKMNSQLALVTFITIPLLFITVFFLQSRMTKAYHKTRRRLADITANLQESISGMRVTQAFTREDVNADKFTVTNEQNFQAQMEAARYRAIFFPMVDIIGTVGVVLVYYYGGHLRMTFGDSAVTIGMVSVFVNYVNRFFWPIRNLVEVWDSLLQASVSAERIFEILDTAPNVADKPDAIALGKLEGHVEFKDVTFGYDPNLPVLHGVNIEAKPDETIALVGPTGAGKSSVINLLCRFYDVQGGEVTVDGHDIRDVTIESLRQNLGIVLQDTVIFSGTIRDNIRYGRLDATDEEVEEAARVVGAHEFIERQPDGYDTQVRERGSRLSVGQRQLLAFARALLANPRILILDEATSSVDAYTELQIQRALETLLKGRTSIVIAHRLSTIRNADRIYVIEQGLVKEVGNHEDLIARGGLYKSLYEKQFAGGPATPEEAPEVSMEQARASLRKMRLQPGDSSDS